MEHRDEIDKWLFEEFQLMPGCCASQLDLQYRTARMVAEKLWPIKNAASDLVDAVERYTRQECLRSELMIKKDKLKELINDGR